jgi:hypothetical protein
MTSPAPPGPGDPGLGLIGIEKAKSPSADLTTSQAGRPGGWEIEARISSKTEALAHIEIIPFTINPLIDHPVLRGRTRSSITLESAPFSRADGSENTSGLVVPVRPRYS